MSAKKSTVGRAAELRAAAVAAAGKPQPGPVAVAPQKQAPARVLIQAHYPPEVRRALLLVMTKHEGPRTIRDLLGEAINDLCTKYGVAPPFNEQEA